MSGLTLFQIDERVREILTMEGDVQQDALDDTIESLGLQEKVRAYICVAKELEASGNARKAESERIEKMAKAELERAEYLRERVKESLVLAGWKKLDFPEFRLTVSPTKGSVQIDTEALIPPMYWRIIPEQRKIDKAAIIADGGCEGVHIEPGYSLRIR